MVREFVLLNQLQAKMVALLCFACKLLQNMQCCNEMVLHYTGVLLHNNNRVLPTLAAGISHTERQITFTNQNPPNG